jgi:hypothetical protein
MLACLLSQNTLQANKSAGAGRGDGRSRHASVIERDGLLRGCKFLSVLPLCFGTRAAAHAPVHKRFSVFACFAFLLVTLQANESAGAGRGNG